MFFDTFIGIFLWIGFWLKMSIRVAFFNGEFHEAIGNFSGTGTSYDNLLAIASVGAAAFLSARFIRVYFFSYPSIERESQHEMTFSFYAKYKTFIIPGFLLFIILIVSTNAFFGIYQRGTVPRTIIPFWLKGIYIWLLLFGMASISAIMLDCELRLKREPYGIVFLCLLECFFSNVSILSRGMILNAGSLLFGIFKTIKKRSINAGNWFKIAIIGILGILFGLSLFMVTYVRSYTESGRNLEGPSSASTFAAFAETTRTGQILLIDRFVGIEGLMAVSSYSGLGWDIWKKAWQEKYSDTGTSLYDHTFIKSPYSTPPKLKHHFISLPGIIAFFYYPGSLPFLFLGILLLGLAGAAIEICVYKIGGGNLILCALIGQVVASRYAHFGYVPEQSYMLIGAIFINIIIIYALNKFLSLRCKAREFFPPQY